MNGERCPSCGTKIMHGWKLNGYPLHGPWVAAHELWEAHCPICRDTVVRASITRRDEWVSWLSHQESLIEGVDYTRGPGEGPKFWQIPYDGRPREMWWLWHPLGDAGEYQAAIEDLLMREAVDSTVLRLAVVAPNQKPIGMNDLWLLKPHVMQGAAGPIASLRAERSLVKTAKALGVSRIFHCWPSTSCLPATDYINIWNENQLVRAWASHSRESYEIGVSQ